MVFVFYNLDIWSFKNVVLVYHVTRNEEIENGLFKKCWPIIKGCVLCIAESCRPAYLTTQKNIEMHK